MGCIIIMEIHQVQGVKIVVKNFFLLSLASFYIYAFSSHLVFKLRKFPATLQLH